MLSRRGNLWFRGRRRDGDVRTKFFEPRLRDAVNGEQVFNALEWAALLAKLHDCLRRARPDSRQLLELLERRRIHIDRLRRRFFLRARQGNKQHTCGEKPAKKRECHRAPSSLDHANSSRGRMRKPFSVSRPTGRSRTEIYQGPNKCSKRLPLAIWPQPRRQ